MDKHIAIDPKSLPLPVTVEPESMAVLGEAVAAVGAKPGVRVQSQTTDPSKPADTTFEQNLMTASQRDINNMWESTQMKVALSVVWSSLIVAMVLAIFGKYLSTATELQLAAVVFIFGVANLVTGFYFGRTNHTKTGGVGSNEKER